MAEDPPTADATDEIVDEQLASKPPSEEGEEPTAADEDEEAEEAAPPSKRVRANPRPRSRVSGAAAESFTGAAGPSGKRSKTGAASRTKRSTGAAKAPLRSKRGRASATAVEDEEEPEEDESETRCICNLNEPDDALGFMIQCETCKVWQHGLCVGFADETNVPDLYFCERCRPDMHAKRQAKRDSTGGRRRATVEVEGRSRRPSSHEEDDSSIKAEPTEDMPPPPPRSHHRRSKSGTEAGSPTLPSAVAALRNPGSAVYPPTSHFAEVKSAKRRSTMNSRDAQFEEQLAAAVALSKAEGLAAGVELPTSEAAGSVVEEAIADDDEEDEEEPEPVKPRPPPRKRPLAAQGTKRRRVEEEDETSHGRGSRSPPSDAESGSDGAQSNSSAPRVRGGRFGKKPRTAERDAMLAARRPARQPNQYSKRHDSGAGSASPAPPGSPAMGSGTESATPAPGPSRKSPSKRKAATAAATAIAEGNSSHGGGRRGKAVPDAIAISWGLPDHLSHLGHLLPPTTPTPITLGTGGSPVASGSRHPSPSSSTASMNGAGGEVVVEPAHRIRYPHKRATMPDMRRRTDAVLHYLGRVTTDLADSTGRAHKLGLADGLASAAATPSTPASASTDALLDNLQREISRFHERFFGVPKKRPTPPFASH